MNFKYFSIDNNSDIDSIKKQYYKLAKQCHPDMGGSNEAMKEIITEYEKVLKYIGNMKGKTYKLDQEFIDIIEKIINLNIPGIEIEICGWFVYVWNVPKQCKNMVNKKHGIGLNWNSKKSVWYYKPIWYSKRNKNSWDMEKIRNAYGSEKVHYEQKERVLITA